MTALVPAPAAAVMSGASGDGQDRAPSYHSGDEDAADPLETDVVLDLGKIDEKIEVLEAKTAAAKEELDAADRGIARGRIESMLPKLVLPPQDDTMSNYDLSGVVHGRVVPHLDELERFNNRLYEARLHYHTCREAYQSCSARLSNLRAIRDNQELINVREEQLREAMMEIASASASQLQPIFVRVERIKQELERYRNETTELMERYRSNAAPPTAA